MAEKNVAPKAKFFATAKEFDYRHSLGRKRMYVLRGRQLRALNNPGEE
jgi:hypothetical protein